MTLFRMSQPLGERIEEELLVAPKFCGCRFGEQRKGNHAVTFRHLGGGQGIANHCGHLLHPSLPAGVARISENHAIRVKAGSREHRTSKFEESGPAGSDSDERIRASRQPLSERPRDRLDGEREQLRSGGKRLSHRFFLINKRHGNRSFKFFGVAACLQPFADYRECDRPAHLKQHNAPQIFIRLDEQKMIGRLESEPLAETRLNASERHAQLAGRAEKICNQLVESELRGRRALRLALSNVDAASASEFNPAAFLQLPVGGAHGIGMQAESPREFARAGQSLLGSKLVAQNAENYLRHELLPDGHFAVARKPESHGALCYAAAIHSDKLVEHGFRLMRDVTFETLGNELDAASHDGDVAIVGGNRSQRPRFEQKHSFERHAIGLVHHLDLDGFVHR